MTQLLPQLRIISIPRAVSAVAVFCAFLVPRDRIYPGEDGAHEWVAHSARQRTWL